MVSLLRSISLPCPDAHLFIEHAYAAEHLLSYLRPGAKVLDIGSGSGYLVAVLHHLVSPGGKVVGIEHIKELVDWSKENLRRDGLGHALDSGEIVMIAGDGRQGFPADGMCRLEIR
jgi:protein-L-isoaspartate(D-aspartate) O-methyltransferase